MPTVKLKKSGKKILKKNSIAALQEFLKGPPALTLEEAYLLDQIIQAKREGKVLPIPELRSNDECSSGNDSY